MTKHRAALLCIFFFSFTSFARLTDGEASLHTINRWKEVKKEFDFSNQEDFASVNKGFIATLKDGVIRSGEKIIFDLNRFAFFRKETPHTVNPSLWRQGKLNTVHGLFKVVDGIYQIRGFDISNMTLIAGKKGWIVVDPLVSAEAARAGLDLANEKLGKRPVTGVIFTHTHVDHFGGIYGVVSKEDVEKKRIPIVAPEHFMTEAVSELVVSGNAMKRRASYMFGNLLPASEKGMVGTGLGQTTSVGSVALVPPTKTVTKTGQKVRIDGTIFEFQMTPDAEAPAEFVFYIPKYKAFCSAEEMNHTMHNLYTLRGAKIRHGLIWAKHINKAIDLFADRSDVLFGSHNWPVWGKEKINDFMKKQRDVYKFTHDQTVRLMNHGMKPNEIAEIIKLPDALAKNWATRGYYGTLSHNIRAQYNLYLGFFDGNPANLNPLPEVQESKEFVKLMGGARKVIHRAKAYIKNGEYRFSATLLNKVVMSEKNNKEAKQLLAQVYEQLGFQAESGPWRNFYLTGAQELRHGIEGLPEPYATSEEIVKGLTMEQALDFLATRLNATKIGNKKFVFNTTLVDTNQKATLLIENGVLNYRLGEHAKKADAEIRLPKKVFYHTLLTEKPLPQDVRDEFISISGDKNAWEETSDAFDRFKFWFPLVEPLETTEAA